MKVVKVLGNNVIVANHDKHNEVILVGKGIGFKKSPGSVIDLNAIEKTFVLYDEGEKARYKKLLSQVDDQMILCMDEIMSFLKDEFGTLPQELLVNLTDHVAFCITRIQSDMVIRNSILKEIKLLYPDDFKIAKNVCEIIHKHVDVRLPEDEVAFVALYIHTASNNRAAKDVRVNAHIISLIIELIEKRLEKPLDKEGLFYKRFLHHLQFTIDRIRSDEYKQSEIEISKLIRDSYPSSFQLASEIGQLLSKNMRKEVAESEIVYLAIHLERINS